MSDAYTEQDLKDRLTLIEAMIAEGRRTTESWGWVFILWGVAFYVALGWSAWRYGNWAWPVTMTLALLVTFVVASWKADHQPHTNLGRAIGSLWAALGVSMFLLFASLGVSGRLSDPHVFIAIVSAIMGLANGASAMILRWNIQFGCAVVWWIAAVASCFGSDLRSLIVFCVAIFLCQILFGFYALISDARLRRRRTPRHA
jgi:hypothetical protein